MDNLTHSLTGLAAGELIHRCLPPEPEVESMRLRRTLLLFACWFASNFPDLDLVLTPLLPEPLGYLLHHRGHTHTFLYELPQALLVFAFVWILVPQARALFRQSGAARVGMALSILLGLVLHIAMDYLNSYGIHPFHPFDSRWFYGDMVFIVEPAFWVALGVPLIMMIPRTWFRRFLFAALPAVLLTFTLQNYLLWQSLGALLAMGAILFFLRKRTHGQGIAVLVLGFAFGLSFIAGQALASRQARDMLAEISKHRHSSSVLRDAALSPFPANPLCWTFVAVESDEAAGTYSLRKGLLSIAPGLVQANRCPPAMLAAPFGESTAQDAIFLETYTGQLQTLRSLKNRSCHFQAWLRFARAPRLDADAVSDMRYSFRSEENFTRMEPGKFEATPCPAHVPQWDFPRRDLLQESETR